MTSRKKDNETQKKKKKKKKKKIKKEATSLTDYSVKWKKILRSF